MASFYNKEIKAGLTQISNSNKNIFLKKDEKKEKRKNVLITNSSIKKFKQIKKISINDNENKSLITKSNKKLDSSNKENHVINNKDKNDLKKFSQKKILKNIVNATKIHIKQNLPKKMSKNIKNQNSNKLSILLNNSGKKTKINNSQKEDEIQNSKILQNKEKDNNPVNISNNQSIIIKNEERDELEEILFLKEKENTFRYDRKNMSEKKIGIKTGGSTGNILLKMRKEHIKYSIKKKNPNISIKNKKLIYEDDYLNNSYIKKYNSINNEKENNRSYIDIINNFDIINIINKKEEIKKLSSSIQQDKLNNSHDYSKNKNIKEKNNQRINNPTNSTNNNNKKIFSKKEYEKPNIPMIMRNINSSKNSLSLIKTEKRMNNISCLIENKNITQNKWDNKYFIPIVSASLINVEEKKKERAKYYKKINTNKNSLIRNNYITNSKKSINFGDNNKKKREILFNFSNKKIKSDEYSFISFQTKRTNSFIAKRNKHITERNNSINLLEKNKFNLENDLKQQEKKLEIIQNKISEEKIKGKNEYNICGISVDNIYDNSFDKNKMEEIINRKHNKKNNKKYKTFHIKVNSLNIIKNKKIGENKTLIIKRGDLLNRLRKIKHNYFIMENEKQE